MAYMSRTGILSALVLALGLLSSGCWGNGNGNTTAPENRIPQKADENQINPQPRDKVQQGGRLVWPTSTPANFNYGQLDGTNFDGAMMINAVMPMLFTFDVTGTPAFDPNYLVAEPELGRGVP